VQNYPHELHTQLNCGLSPSDDPKMEKNRTKVEVKELFLPDMIVFRSASQYIHSNTCHYDLQPLLPSPNFCAPAIGTTLTVALTTPTARFHSRQFHPNIFGSTGTSTSLGCSPCNATAATLFVVAFIAQAQWRISCSTSAPALTLLTSTAQRAPCTGQKSPRTVIGRAIFQCTMQSAV
jgi:hypothetical protein